MKNLATKLMIAAATMAVAAGAASAQVMKADVPFAFRAAGQTMAAGTYVVSINLATGMLEIQDKTGIAAVLLLPTSRIEGGKDGDAKLVFSCPAGNCTLVQAWSGTPGAAYSFKSPKDRNAEASLAVIHLRRDGAN